MTPATNRSRLSSRQQFLLLVALFAAPLLAAWLLVGHWRPAGMTHHGELLDPAQPVAYLRVRQVNGQELNTAYLHGRWTLAYIGAGCGERCQHGLYNMRQVRLALGKDMGRAQTLLMLSEAPGPELAEWLNREHAAMTVGVADAATLSFFGQAFAGGEAAANSWIYLIDPLGNLVMRYRTDDNPKGILEDLRRLFKYSKIG